MTNPRKGNKLYGREPVSTVKFVLCLAAAIAITLVVAALLMSS